MIFDPNPLYFYMCQLWQEHKKEGNIIEIYNQGGTRSSKTWDAIHLLVSICDHNRGKELRIYVLRDTLARCKDKTVPEFQKCFKQIGISSKVMSANHKPYINLWGNHIYFRGLPDDNEEGWPADILYFNEMLEMEKQPVEDLIMRCEKLVLGDYNPKYTAHWLYGKEGTENVFFTKTTYQNNKHLPLSVKRTIEAYEPWETGSYEVRGNDILYKGHIVDTKHQPPQNPIYTQS